MGCRVGQRPVWVLRSLSTYFPWIPTSRDYNLETTVELSGRTRIGLGKTPRPPRSDRTGQTDQVLCNQPCNSAYFTMSIRPFSPSFRMAFALCASTVFTLSDSLAAI